MTAILAHECVFVRDSSTQAELFKLGFGATRSQQELKQSQQAANEVEEDAQATTSLLLLDEEALYLTINKQIVVYDLHTSSHTPSPVVYDSMQFALVQRPVVGAEELYTLFQRKYSKFPLKYKVYSYFRDHGCCVHTAVNYGLDYAIYQTLPSLCHSALSVLVVDGVSAEASSAEGMRAAMECGNESLRWTHVSAMTRVMGDVSKLLLMCHVIPAEHQLYDNSHPLFLDEDGPEEMRDGLDLSQLSCLSALQVKPVSAVVRRHIADNSDHYVTVKSMQQNFAKNLKTPAGKGKANLSVKNKNADGKAYNKFSGENGKGPPQKRKRKGDDGSVEYDKEVKVSRHAKHWKSLYAAEFSTTGTSSSSVNGNSTGNNSNGSVGTSDAAAEGDDVGGLFGWLGAIFSGSEY